MALKRTVAALLAVLMTAGQSAYALTDIKPGDHLRQTRHWDSETNRFVDRAAEGEGEGCWQVLSVSRTSVELKLVSGLFKPWWSDEPIKVGSKDTWFDSDGFIEKNPGRPPLSEIRETFSKVASCS